MTRDETIGLLSSRRQDLLGLGVKSLAIFGSIARNEAGPESDVDVLVEFQGAATFDGYLALKDYLEDLLGREVDLVTRNALRPRLKDSVEHEAIYVS